VAGAIGPGEAPIADLTRRALSAGLDVLASPPSKGRFLAVAQSAGSSTAPYRARALGDLASIVEGLLTTQRRPVDSRDAHIAALAAVGAVLSIIDAWLGQELDLTRDEVVSWSTTATAGIIEAV
jgi:hypothetical protein